MSSDIVDKERNERENNTVGNDPLERSHASLGLGQNELVGQTGEYVRDEESEQTEKFGVHDSKERSALV